MFMLIDVGVMLLIILPTTIAIIWFLWRYRKSRKAAYEPGFSHSTKLEALMWGVPIATVIALGFASYFGTFAVNPYRPSILQQPAKPGHTNPMTIDVISTDWQWVFIYPKQHIATVDRLVVPRGRTIVFRLTSTSVVNDFFIPQLNDMIDVMPGMRTKDAMRATRLGTFIGFSANFSGAGFSWMKFPTNVVTPADFDKWVARTAQSPQHLTYARFEILARPIINLTGRPLYFSAPAPHLFRRVIKAAHDGKVYPIPDQITAHMADAAHHHAAYLDMADHPPVYSPHKTSTGSGETSIDTRNPSR